MSTDTQTQELETLLLAQNYKNWILGSLDSFIGKRILEVGGGVGLYTEEFRKKGFVTTTEVSQHYYQKLKTEYIKDTRVKISNIDVSSLTNREKVYLKQIGFDTVVLINVLEHIEEDQKSLSNLYEILSDNGKIIIFVPAFNLLFGTIDKLVGHFRRYTKKDLRNKLEKSGFKVEKSFYFNLIGFFGWFVNNRIRKIKNNSKLQVEFFDKVIVPVVSRVEKVVRPTLGQSLVAVGVKRPIIK